MRKKDIKKLTQKRKNKRHSRGSPPSLRAHHRLLLQTRLPSRACERCRSRRQPPCTARQSFQAPQQDYGTRWPSPGGTLDPRPASSQTHELSCRRSLSLCSVVLPLLMFTILSFVETAKKKKDTKREKKRTRSITQKRKKKRKKKKPKMNDEPFSVSAVVGRKSCGTTVFLNCDRGWRKR